jgi:Ran GTPase-activating protein (RanGAP) involved in mRNA processing and transport
MARDDFLALGLNLQTNTLLTQLELFEEELMGVPVRDLAEGLMVTKSLRLLELSFCQFDNKGVEMLALGLHQNQSLESLLLPGCELEDDQITQVIQSLLNHPRLGHIKLFRNHCGTEGASAVAKLLAAPPTRDETDTTRPAIIRSLDLKYQQFERANKLDLGLISSQLAENTYLTSLILSFNKLNDTDAETLAHGLRNNRVLQELDLRANRIRDAGTIALAEHLVANQHTSLIKLFLFGNPFGGEGGRALLQSIRGNSEMVILNMDYNSCSYDEIQFCTYLNRAGRRLLKEDRLNPAIWPLVLERAQNVSRGSRGICTDADLLFELVRGGPALLC